MLHYDDRRSNVPSLVHIVLIDVFFLLLKSVVKEMRNSQESMRRKVMMMFSKEGKSYKRNSEGQKRKIEESKEIHRQSCIMAQFFARLFNLFDPK